MKKKTIIIIGCVVVVLLIIIIAAKSHGTSYQFVAVTQGSITQEVDVTGNTTPVQSLDLAFENGGTISAVDKQAGDTVAAGDILVQLDTRNLEAQLAQAQANVQAEQAKLEGLQAGPTPQNVEVSQTALASAEQSLTNEYAGVEDTVTAALAKADDAVNNQLSAFYTNPASNNPQLTFAINNEQVENNADFQRVSAGDSLSSWETEVESLNPDASTSTLDQTLVNATNYLTVIETLLETDATAVNDAISMPATTAAAYNNDVSTAVSEVEDAAGSVSGSQQAIASDEAAIAQAQAALSVTLAGSTSQDIAAQQAAVAQAQASVQQIQVEINQSSLVSPIAGVVTVQNANVGEIAAAGETITSVISNNDLEIDADVPETDIGKVSVGNPVSMTFNAFPDQTFTGKVFYIDPAQTIIGGVVDYLVKVSIDQSTSTADIKSGLTTNLTIMTQTDQNALILPQYAIIQNASGTFVEVLQNNAVVQVPVTVGIEDQNGNAEIKQGVTAGEQVINVGLKTN